MSLVKRTLVDADISIFAFARGSPLREKVEVVAACDEYPLFDIDVHPIDGFSRVARINHKMTIR